MAGYEIRTTLDKGRAIHATRPYKKDEIIFEESPFVSAQLSWNAAYKYLACEYCLRPLETAEQNVQRLSSDRSIKLPQTEFCPTIPWLSRHVKCSECSVGYCSQECLVEAANKYHTALCLGNQTTNLDHPINKLNEEWKKMHYPPETCTILLIAKILGMIKQSSVVEISSKLNEFQSIAINQNEQIFHKLLGEHFQRDFETLYQLTCDAFQLGTDVNQLSMNFDEFKKLFTILGTNGQGIGTSPFSEWVNKATEYLETLGDDDQEHAFDVFTNDLYNKMDEVSGVFLNAEGTGLYHLQSKLNHSCSPNVEITFPYSNHTLAVKAIEEINIGDEICISYLDECMLARSRHSRRKELSENYLFICQCPLCEAQIDQPDETSEDEDDDEDDEEMDD